MTKLAKIESAEESVADIGLLALPGCTFTETGLTLAPDLEFDQWLQVGSILCRSEKSVRWWIGDWLAYGEHKWGEKYAQGEVITGIDEKTLQNYHFVAASVQNSRRREKLSWSHHREVAGLKPVEQERMLKAAETLKLGKLDLRRQVQQNKIIEAESINDNEPVKIDFAKVRVRWREVRSHLDQFKADFPQFERHVNGWIAEMKEELENPAASGGTFLEALIEDGTWDIDGLVDATKYTKATVIALCDQLIDRGSHEWRDKGGETEQARGARSRYIAPRGAPRGDYFEYPGRTANRMWIDEDDE